MKSRNKFLASLALASFLVINQASASTYGDTVIKYFDGTNYSEHLIASANDAFTMYNSNTGEVGFIPANPDSGLYINPYGQVDIHQMLMSKVDGLEEALSNKALIGHTHIIADIGGLQSQLDAKAGTASVDGTNNGLMPSYLFNRINAFPIFGTGTQADWDATNTLSVHYIQNKPPLSKSDSIRVQTNSTGDYTWTYSTSFSSAPVVTGTTETGTSTNSCGVQIVSKSATQVVVKNLCVVPSVPVLGLVLGLAPAATQSFIDLVAVGN